MLLWMLACAAPTPEGAPGHGDAPPPDADPAPYLEPAAVQDGLEVGLGVLLSSPPLTIHDTYYRVLGVGDDTCPWRSDAYSGQQYWEDDCDAADGSAWYGWALSAREQDIFVDPERRAYSDIGWYYGAGRVTDASGAVFDGWGSADFRAWASTNGSPVRGFFASVGGTWGWSGSEPGWLTDGHNHGWTIEGERNDIDVWFRADGGLSRLEGELSAFSFEQLVANTTETGCFAEPSGTLNLHHGPTQRWYRVRFDPSAACDGCGALTAEDTDLGEVCIDWAPFFDWQDHLWEDAR